MSFLLDTDICSAHLKGHRRVSSLLAQYDGRVWVSVITLGELFTWALRKKAARLRLDALADFQAAMPAIPVDEATARQFGEIRARLFDVGRPIAAADALIAATALVHDLTVVTHNTADFDPVPDLRIADWL